MRHFSAWAASAAIAWLLAAPVAHALSGNEQVALAGSGRYEELWQGLEPIAAKGPMKTRDLHALCFAYAKSKRYNRLMPCLDRLAKNVADGDTRTRLFGLDDVTPALHIMRAEAQLEMANYPAALAEGRKALEWFRAEGPDDKDIGLNALSLMSMAATLSGNRGDGEKYVRELQAIGTFTLLGNGYVSAKAMAAARAHMALGNYQQVLDAFAQDKLFSAHAFLDKLVSGALISGRSHWVWQELPRAFMTARAQHGIGNLAEAKRGYDSLLAVPQVKDNGDIYWQLLVERGIIAESEGLVDQAIDLFRRAIEVIEMQRSTINTESSKIGFVGDKQRVYERLIAALYASHRQADAFEVIERSKSRALVDMLASRHVATLQYSSDNAAGQAAREFDEAQSEMLAQVPVSAAEGRGSQRGAAAQAAQKLRAAAPELASLISVSAMPPAKLRDALPQAEAIVQYYYQGPHLYASVFGHAGIQMIRLDATGMEAEIQRFREAIDKMEESAAGLSTKLYDRLLRPLEPHLGSNQRLLIIPHGALHYLPFAALSNGSQVLIERYALRTLPSASVLQYLRGGTTASGSAMLVLGNPDLGDPKNDLPSAQVEAEKIAAQSKDAKLVLRGAATETLLKSSALSFPVLHIASHGVFDAAKPLDSALLLAKDSLNDGKLTVSELYGIRLNANLVTLSACETGLGKINTGDDVVGLTRGFLYAGASSVVASLWQVDDEATSQLMIRFYAELASKSKQDALRAAQLEVRKKFPHPYYWSAFYLTGSAS